MRFAAVSTVALFLISTCVLAQPPVPDVQFLFDGDLSSQDSTHTGSAMGDSVGFDSETPFTYTGNQSLELGGSDDYVDVASLAGALTGDTAVTMSMWIRNRAGIGNDRPFLGLSPPSGGDDGGARYDDAGFNGPGNDVIKVSLPGLGSYEGEDNTQVQDAWQHVAIVYDGTDLELYVDGVLDTPTSDDIGTGPIGAQTAFLFGSGPKGPDATWDGFIDEVGIWFDQSLSQEDVAFLSQNSLQALAIPEPASVAIWSLIGLGLAGFGYYRVKWKK